jgi:hypothetical protein
MEDPNLGWEDPIDQASSLRSAVKELLAVGLGPRERGGTGPFEGTVCGVSERFERATSSLWKYRRWPDRVKSRLENIRNARVAVRRDYPTHTHPTHASFQFALLSPRERRALADDIFAIYEACLLDIGRMHERGGLAGEWYNFIYPKDAAPRTIKLGREAGELSMTPNAIRKRKRKARGIGEAGFSRPGRPAAATRRDNTPHFVPDDPLEDDR